MALNSQRLINLWPSGNVRFQMYTSWVCYEAVQKALETSLPQGGLKVIFGSLSQASTLTLSKNKMVAIIIIIKPLFKEGGT